MVRQGITVYLPRDLEQAVAQFAREEGRSASSVIAESVRVRFSKRTSPEVGSEAWGQRLAARMDARFDKAIGEALIAKEVLLLFVRVWLEHNPPLDEGLEESAAQSAEARFERFLELVANGLKPGGRSLSDTGAELSAIKSTVQPNGHDSK
jgi:hypothetical protein